MVDKVYFKREQLLTETLKETVGIQAHLAFIEKLIHKYEWNDLTKREIMQSCNKIRDRDKDPSLYLAVVGEFSSGKSTLINSLLRDELLRTNVIQATTSAATVISYGSNLDVAVTYLNGDTKSFRQEHFSTWDKILLSYSKPKNKRGKGELVDFLHSVTVDEEIAKQVARVSIFHPAGVLKQGLVIVDTPGANADNPRHIEVTGWAIREMCDAAIIVIPADIPVSQSLTVFLKTHLNDVLHRCIFIVTKLDLIRRAGEREPLIKNIKKRLSMELGLSKPKVLVYTPLLVMEQLVKGQPAENRPTRLSEKNRRDLLEYSLQTENDIQQILRKQKELIQVERLSLMLAGVFTRLNDELKKMEESYQARHRALERNRITNLSVFITRQKKLHEQMIKNNALPFYEESANIVNESKQKVLAELQNDIKAATDEKSLRDIVRIKTPALMQKAQEDIRDRLAGIFAALDKTGQQELQHFEQDFKQLYTSLATLDGQITFLDQEAGQNVSTTLLSQFEDNSSNLNIIVNADESKENLLLYGGAGAGAAIGTLVLPVIGTAIGGFVGWLAGALSTPLVRDLRAKYWNELNTGVSRSFAEFERLVVDTVENAVAAMIAGLNDIIDTYFIKYEQLVEQMMARDEAEAAELRRRQAMIGGDLSRLEAAIRQLSVAQESLRSL